MIQDHKRHRPKETAPARGGAGAVVVGVTYAEGGSACVTVNAPPIKSFPSRRGDPAARCGRGMFRYAGGTF
jgi:hypothetical protein